VAWGKWQAKKSSRLATKFRLSSTERTEHLRDLSVEALEALRSQRESRLVAAHSLANYEDFRRPSLRSLVRNMAALRLGVRIRKFAFRRPVFAAIAASELRHYNDSGKTREPCAGAGRERNGEGT